MSAQATHGSTSASEVSHDNHCSRHKCNARRRGAPHSALDVADSASWKFRHLSEASDDAAAQPGSIEPDGFQVAFTKPVEKSTGNSPDSYAITNFTHPYHGGYGGPEIEQTTPKIESVSLAEDGLSAKLVLNKLTRGFVYNFDLVSLRSLDNEELLHRNAYYTVNEIPIQK